MVQLAVAVARADKRKLKVKRLMNCQLPYAMKLAALNASGTDKGKVW
jgi:hypothetical protein